MSKKKGWGGVKAAAPCIQVRLIVEPHVFLTPQQIHEYVLQPAGAGRALAIAAVGARETRVTFRSWADAYRVLCYCSPELQSDLGLRCRPGLAMGVQMTKSEMAKLAQAEQGRASEARSQHGAGTSAGLKSPRSASFTPPSAGTTSPRGGGGGGGARGESPRRERTSGGRPRSAPHSARSGLR